MNLYAHFSDRIATALDQLQGEGLLPADIDTSVVTVEPPREAAHGDLATIAAMVLAKKAGMAPRELAEKLGALVHM